MKLVPIVYPEKWRTDSLKLMVESLINALGPYPTSASATNDEEKAKACFLVMAHHLAMLPIPYRDATVAAWPKTLQRIIADTDKAMSAVPRDIPPDETRH